MAKHFDIGDYALQVHVPKRRRWAQSYSEWRFLLLGPRAGGERGFRPLVASGDIVDGRCHIDHGTISTEQVAAIEALPL